MDFDAYERKLWAGRVTDYDRGFARLTAYTVGALLDAVGVEPGTRVVHPTATIRAWRLRCRAGRR